MAVCSQIIGIWVEPYFGAPSRAPSVAAVARAALGVTVPQLGVEDVQRVRTGMFKRRRSKQLPPPRLMPGQLGQRSAKSLPRQRSCPMDFMTIANYLSMGGLFT